LEVPFAKSKVSDYWVPELINEDIFWFEVSVNEVFFVKLPEGTENARSIESRNLFIEFLENLKMEEQFSSRTVVNHHE